MEAVIDELDDARTIAMRNEHASAMVAATLGKAKIAGLDVHRSGKPGDFTSVTNMTELADKLLAGVGADPEHITTEMREMTLAELRRHAEAISAIGNNADSSQQH